MKAVGTLERVKFSIDDWNVELSEACFLRPKEFMKNLLNSTVFLTIENLENFLRRRSLALANDEHQAKQLNLASMTQKRIYKISVAFKTLLDE